jgi:regulator of replication initiation timing
MGWKPKFFDPRKPAASAEDADDLVVDPASLAEGDDALTAQVATLTAQVGTLTAQVETLTASLATATEERDTLKASNEQLSADLAAAQEATASQQVSALEQAQDAAHAAAVRAFGQASPALEQAEADIAQCESVREANALERTYKLAEPKGLTAPARQTVAQKAQTTGRTSAKAHEPTEEERAQAANSVKQSF